MANFFLRSRPTTAWAATTAYTLGQRRIKLAGNFFGIHFEVTTAGTSGGAEPAWNTTVGGTTTDNTATWTTRGSADTWVASTAYVAGDRVVATTAASVARQVFVFECTTGGTSGAAEPAWSVTVGGTQADGTVTWTVREATTWNNAHIDIHRLTVSTLSAPAAGDTVFISDEHNQSATAAVTINLRGSGDSPVRVLCVNDTGDPASPSILATTARIITTGATNIFIASVGSGTMDGVEISAGDGANAASISIFSSAATSSSLILNNCKLTLGGNSGAITLGAASTNLARNNIRWVNTKVEMVNIAQAIQPRTCNFEWLNTPGAIVGTAPTGLIAFQLQGLGTVRLEGLDLSAVTSGKSVIDQANGSFRTLVRNCDMGSGSVTSAVHPGSFGGTTTVISTDSVITQFERSAPGGVTTSNLVNVRTGGATNGVTPFSWRVVTTAAAARFDTPFVGFPIRVWNTVTGSPKTITVEILHDSLTALTDAEVWLQVDAQTEAVTLRSTFTDDSSGGPLATGVAQTASTATWVTTGITNPNKQKLAVTVTPQHVGLITARVFVAKASTTVFVDPFLTVL